MLLGIFHLSRDDEPQGRGWIGRAMRLAESIPPPPRGMSSTTARPGRSSESSGGRRRPRDTRRWCGSRGCLT
jgi:hypothetical protein